MNCFSFVLKSATELNNLILNIQIDYQCFWIRDQLHEKRLMILDRNLEIGPKDVQGRVFCKDFELRYRIYKQKVKCIWTGKIPTEVSEIIPPDNKVVEIIPIGDPRTFYVSHLKSIIKSKEKIFPSEIARIQLQEYHFDDEVGGYGYYVCGVL